jgi:hypothetical protein
MKTGSGSGQGRFFIAINPQYVVAPIGDAA